MVALPHLCPQLITSAINQLRIATSTHISWAIDGTLCIRLTAINIDITDSTPARVSFVITIQRTRVAVCIENATHSKLHDKQKLFIQLHKWNGNITQAPLLPIVLKRIPAIHIRTYSPAKPGVNCPSYHRLRPKTAERILSQKKVPTYNLKYKACN